MHFFTSPVLLSLLTATAVNAAYLSRTVEAYNGDTSGRYIVKLKDGISKTSVLASIEHGITVTHDWELINGFAGHLNDVALTALLASPDVEYVSQDGIAEATATQRNAPWGLSRISSSRRLYDTNAGALNFTYRYSRSAGYGVDVYVLDTGVYTGHSEFGGRARWGAVFGGHAWVDRKGHGTHVAGTVAGHRFGVAKATRIIAVKVLGDNGKGAYSDIISGMNWVRARAAWSGRPSVVCMSLGGGASNAVDHAVAGLTNAGVHVVVAAGNDNKDAGSTSPARAPSAITVGATDIADNRATYSNYGSVVNIFAPGTDVLSAGLRGPYDVVSMSGTSMATPHVAGLVAYLIALEGNRTPQCMKAKLQRLARRNVISGIPWGTVNLLAQNGYWRRWLSEDRVEEKSTSVSDSGLAGLYHYVEPVVSHLLG